MKNTSMRLPGKASRIPGALFATSILLLCLLSLGGCKKFLDAKPDAKLTTPATVEDLQLLLDNYYAINNSYPPLAEVMSDNYYLTTTDWSGMSYSFYRNLYLWAKDDEDATAYANPYKVILITNTILDQLPEVRGSEGEKEKVRGRALFLRAAYAYGLAQLYAPPYQNATADELLGIPIRISSDYNLKSVRPSLRQSYDQIIADLATSALLLPLNDPLKTRPTRLAAYGWLARTYLDMGQYEKALSYADSCLRLYDRLINFNSLNAAANAPIPRFNEEVIFHLRGYTALPLATSIAKVDSNLYAAYALDDLRKKVYFKNNGNGTFAFKGDYDGSGTSSGYVFSGIVTDEMYLIRAECFARTGKTQLALDDLNTLLRTRWATGTFVPFTAGTPAAALALVLSERRKELLGRGTRWSDLRRLSLEGGQSIIPKRYIDNKTYELQPGSPRYTILFPAFVIQQTGMPQNP